MKYSAGLALFIFILAGAALMPFSALYFKLFGIDPIILPVIHGQASPHSLYGYFVDGKGFQSNEMQHFADVSHILRACKLLTLLLSAYLMVMFWRWRTAFYAALTHPLYYCIGLISVTILTWVCFGWKPLTAALHTIAFPHGNWRFSVDSLTITLYGRSLMQYGLISVLFLAGALSCALYILGQYKKHILAKNS